MPRDAVSRTANVERTDYTGDRDTCCHRDRAILVKIPVEICQFTRVAMNSLNVSLWDRIFLLRIHRILLGIQVTILMVPLQHKMELIFVGCRYYAIVRKHFVKIYTQGNRFLVLVESTGISDCIYHFPIDLEPIAISFGSKSIVK